eukprot:XP_008763008.1 PREDICTED: SPARC-related modular calcium-binding protein 1 isoform X4 [Rattus norvegicus]
MSPCVSTREPSAETLPWPWSIEVDAKMLAKASVAWRGLRPWNKPRSPRRLCLSQSVARMVPSHRCSVIRTQGTAGVSPQTGSPSVARPCRIKLLYVQDLQRGPSTEWVFPALVGWPSRRRQVPQSQAWMLGPVTDKPLSQGNSGRKDDGSKPTPTMETQPVFDGDEITAPTLWIKHLVIKDSKLNNTNVRNSEKVHSCDQERQSALEEARQNPREGIVIPECAPGGLYKPVQCHQSTGYCWCVLVDTGRPLPGTSTRYVMPSCESDARAKSVEVDDPFKDRELPGCPEGKKMEFITSLLDALTTDMVQAINSAAPTGGGRFSEPDPSHTLEERVAHWYFSQLDSNSSDDINKREMKPFKRYVKKKAKPKKCARRFTDYCDLNKDKAISLPELKGCLGVSKEGGSLGSFPQGKRAGTNPFIGRLV